MNKEKFENAVEKAYLQLSAMGEIEFKALLERNKDGEYAKIVRETMVPDIELYRDWEHNNHSIAFDTYIQLSLGNTYSRHSLIDYVNCATDLFIPLSASNWSFNGLLQITVTSDSYDQDYLWALAA